MVLSLVILVVLLVFTVFRPMVSGETVSELVQESIIKQDDQWIIQIGLANREGKTTNYSISWSSGEQTYTEDVAIKDGGMFTYIHYVYPDRVTDGQVRLEIYKEGEAVPFEESVYHVSFDG
ncbi:hypothetical protein ACFLTS_07245 [Chloroflexota bacterium]